ncbi:hypothetical protein BC832DRAFT_568679, partial [Gaertneriomyces semiglobifer]
MINRIPGEYARSLSFTSICLCVVWGLYRIFSLFSLSLLLHFFEYERFSLLVHHFDLSLDCLSATNKYTFDIHVMYWERNKQAGLPFAL